MKNTGRNIRPVIPGTAIYAAFRFILSRPILGHTPRKLPEFPPQSPGSSHCALCWDRLLPFTRSIIIPHTYHIVKNFFSLFYKNQMENSAFYPRPFLCISTYLVFPQKRSGIAAPAVGLYISPCTLLGRWRSRLCRSRAARWAGCVRLCPWCPLCHRDRGAAGNRRAPGLRR